MQTSAGVASPGSLDDLARLHSDELLAMYQNARTPRLDDLDGRLSGRVMRIHAFHATRFLEPFLRSKLLVWHKTFAHETAGHGHGRLVWFGFKTSVGRSRVGDFDAVHLEYTHPILRWERDEVREIGPRLWLGLWFMRRRDGDHHVGFFGLDREDAGKR